jgi:hypothetical protein
MVEHAVYRGPGTSFSERPPPGLCGCPENSPPPDPDFEPDPEPCWGLLKPDWRWVIPGALTTAREFGAELIGAVGRPASKTLRNQWEKFYNEVWPKTLDGKNFHAHHKDAVSQGGSHDPTNIQPMSPSDYVQHHVDNGDFVRWGQQGSGGRRK